MKWRFSDDLILREAVIFTTRAIHVGLQENGKACTGFESHIGGCIPPEPYQFCVLRYDANPYCTGARSLRPVPWYGSVLQNGANPRLCEVG